MADILTADALQLCWKEVIVACNKMNPEAASLLQISKPISVLRSGVFTFVVLETRWPTHRERLRNETVRLAVQYAIGQVIGTPVAVDIKSKGEEVRTRSTYPVVRPPRKGTGGVRSIPTVYNGIQFRSKLEASTAKLMDDIGLEWQFEVEGYDLGNGIWYLPDFYVPQNRLFIEVKGILDPKSEEKVTALAGACAGSGIRVMLLFNTRPRRIAGLQRLYVAGSLVNADGIIPDSIVLARCPSCQQASWKIVRSATCPLCGRQADSAHEFEAA